MNRVRTHNFSGDRHTITATTAPVVERIIRLFLPFYQRNLLLLSENIRLLYLPSTFPIPQPVKGQFKLTDPDNKLE